MAPRHRPRPRDAARPAPGSVPSRRCSPARPAIVDHHESPHAIEGSLDVIAEACAEVGVRVVCAYGVTDRHGADGARRGLAENERFLRAGGRGLVGVHAAFTCTDDTLEAAAGLAADLGVGVHIHVAEGPDDAGAGERLRPLAADDWLLVHCVELDRDAARHDRPQPPQQHEQRRRLRPPGAAPQPRRARHRRHRRRHARGVPPGLRRPSRRRRHRRRPTRRGRGSTQRLRSWFPRRATDRVTWSYDHADSPWHVAFTPGIRATDVVRSTASVLVRDGVPTRVDLAEVRAHAAEQAARASSRGSERGP